MYCFYFLRCCKKKVTKKSKSKKQLSKLYRYDWVTTFVDIIQKNFTKTTTTYLNRYLVFFRLIQYGKKLSGYLITKIIFDFCYTLLDTNAGEFVILPSLRMKKFAIASCCFLSDVTWDGKLLSNQTTVGGFITRCALERTSSAPPLWLSKDELLMNHDAFLGFKSHDLLWWVVAIRGVIVFLFKSITVYILLYK